MAINIDCTHVLNSFPDACFHFWARLPEAEAQYFKAEKPKQWVFVRGVKFPTSSRLIHANWPISNHNATNYLSSSHNPAINVTLSFRFFTCILGFADPQPMPVYHIALKSHLSSLLPWAANTAHSEKTSSRMKKEKLMEEKLQLATTSPMILSLSHLLFTLHCTGVQPTGSRVWLCLSPEWMRENNRHYLGSIRETNNGTAIKKPPSFPVMQNSSSSQVNFPKFW